MASAGWPFRSFNHWRSTKTTSLRNGIQRVFRLSKAFDKRKECICPLWPETARLLKKHIQDTITTKAAAASRWKPGEDLLKWLESLRVIFFGVREWGR